MTTTATAVPTITSIVYDRDPYLDFQPAFAYSLPIQILLTGVILSLATVLLIHLIFTAPYHWTLAKLNYSLQLAGVLSLLLSLGVSLYVILNSVHQTSRGWPYMLNYVAVDVPLTTWTPHKLGWWYTLDAVTSGFVHITHIQFLTLLYPSRIEVRLIFLLLGPLVLLSSGSSFVEMTTSDGTRAISESVRNICNSTLAILFTIGLCIWGFAINRKEAWRTDGGTAIFGAGALLLSMFSMGLNLLQIAKVPPVWIPGLVWAVVLWQTFLGWWWFIGSAVTLPPKPKKNTKKKQKPEESESKPMTRLRAGFTNAGQSLRRRPSTTRPSDPRDTDLTTISTTTSSLHPPMKPSFMDGILAQFPSLAAWWCRLRQAHSTATELQNAERGSTLPTAAGWGLGSYALREREEIERNRRQEEGRLATDLNSGEASKEATSEEPTEEIHASTKLPMSSHNGSWSWRGPFQRWRLRDITTYG